MFLHSLNDVVFIVIFLHRACNRIGFTSPFFQWQTKSKSKKRKTKHYNSMFVPIFFYSMIIHAYEGLSVTDFLRTKYNAFYICRHRSSNSCIWNFPFSFHFPFYFLFFVSVWPNIVLSFFLYWEKFKWK